MTSAKDQPATKVAERAAEGPKEALPEDAKIARVEIPPVIMTADEYDKAYRYLASRYHVLTPVTAFSGMAPQHGLVVAKVLIDSDPTHGEVYQDRLFCTTGSKDPLDDEVAIAKVGLRKLALAGGWNLQADVLKAERHYWMVRAYNRFVGLDGSVQTFSATEEYDLRDGSPQIRNMTQKQIESARAHGLRGAEARALNAASREFGVRQKFTRRDLQKAFVIMRMMFIPDASNELQMRIVTERALQGTTAMFPQSRTQPLDPIEGMTQPIDVAQTIDVPPAARAEKAARAAEPVDELRLPPGMVLIRDIKEKQVNRKPPKTGSFPKWTVIDSNGEEHVTVKKEMHQACMSCWNKDDWKKGRPLEICSNQNSWKENEITELNPMPLSDEDEPSLPMGD